MMANKQHHKGGNMPPISDNSFIPSYDVEGIFRNFNYFTFLLLPIVDRSTIYIQPHNNAFHFRITVYKLEDK